jgi:hypothetical protein
VAYDKCGHKLVTRVVWVDKLPNESYSEDDSLEKDYVGYRNMTYIDSIEKINDFIAIRRESYNAGAAGVRHMTSEVYIRKDFWKNFHLPMVNPLRYGRKVFRFYFKVDGSQLRTDENIRGFETLDGALRYQASSHYGNDWYLKME